MKRIAWIMVIAALIIGFGYSVSWNWRSAQTPQATPRPPVASPTPTPRATTRPASSAASSSVVISDPYVGMYVSGKPTGWEWQGTDNTTVRDSAGNKIKTTKYRYDTSTRSYTIWVSSAGTVVKVNYSDRSGSSRRTGQRTSVVPSPDVSDYVAPEDFYEWYYDDFSDFEEAEDYYYSHGGQ